MALVLKSNHTTRCKIIGKTICGALVALILGTVTTGCKTTEKNYRQAYDAAQGKRERDEEARRQLNCDMGISDGILRQTDGVEYRRLGQTELPVRHRNFARKDSVNTFSLAVGTFGMPANALSLAERLAAEGLPNAKMAKSGGEYIVIAGQWAQGGDAAKGYKAWKEAHPDFFYVGQPDALIIIGGSPGRR